MISVVYQDYFEFQPPFSSLSSVPTWMSTIHVNLCFMSSFKLVTKVLTRTGFRTDYLVTQ